jgi:hypothetical protein
MGGSGYPYIMVYELSGQALMVLGVFYGAQDRQQYPIAEVIS